MCESYFKSRLMAVFAFVHLSMCDFSLVILLFVYCWAALSSIVASHVIMFLQWQDLKQRHLTLPEAADLAQNRPLWRMMSTYGATQS